MRKLASRRYRSSELASVVGSRIEAFRRERGWTRAQLATQLEVDRKWLEDYERGRKLPPTYSLYQLAGAFGVSVGALLDERAAELPVVAERLLNVLRRFERLPAADREELTLFLEGLLASVERLPGR
ncbi:MAG TPA: helix-turn-helix transcriptional regulator [Thermoanaerobaculia bacterium]|jgi:transcriptional regulator with XRE-family HTH domain|nr:helix-turn-helix transcriptional regulator [Thermoanaerobaculia bacterium]